MEDKKSNLEKITGNISVQASATAAAALVGGPLAALVPLLLATISGTRHDERIKNALSEICITLENMKDLVDQMTDPSYKLLNDAILCLPHSVQEEKIKYLKTCITRCITNDRLNMHNATKIGRLLRDISAEEISFISKYRDTPITFSSTGELHDGVNIDKFSEDGNIATGLVSLGLLVEVGSVGEFSAVSHLKFNDVAFELLKLVE